MHEDQQRARQRLGKFLLRHGWQRPKDIKENWTQKHMTWIKSHVHFEQAASQAAFLDYVHEVEHAADRLQGLEKAIDDAIAVAPAEIQQGWPSRCADRQQRRPARSATK